MGALGVSVAHLDSGSDLDIVFSQYQTSTTTCVPKSYVYWGPSFLASLRSELPTNCARGNVVADFNNDGNQDIVFANAKNATKHSSNSGLSYIYWGPGFTTKGTVATMGPQGTINRDPGSVLTRRGVQTFTSRVFDTGRITPKLTKLTWTSVVTGAKDSLVLQLRSAKDKLSLAKADWYGPNSKTDFYKTSPVTNINVVHKQQYVQYRATFTHVYGTTPVLKKVELLYK